MAQRGFEFCNGCGGADASGDHAWILGERFGHRRGRDDIADRKAAAGREHAERFATHLLLVRRQVDDAVGQDHVDRGVGDGQVLDLAETELDVVRAHALLGGPRALQHLGRHVDADHAAGGADSLRREEAVDAAAAAEVEHAFAGLESCEFLRIAAAKAEVCAFGQRVEVGLRIAEFERRVWVGSATTGRAARAVGGRADRGVVRAHGVADGIRGRGRVGLHAACFG